MGIQWKVKAVGGSGGYAKIGKTVYNLLCNGPVSSRYYEKY